MKLAYYADTDSLYIDLLERPSVESREVSEGIVLDYDGEGHLVGIDIDNASRKVQLQRLVLAGMQGEVERAAGESHRRDANAAISMLFMIVEHFRGGDPHAVYERFRLHHVERGG